ncbi:MAG: DUF2079 domain-containing protein [Verrucomicrobiia bacterium]
MTEVKASPIRDLTDRQAMRALVALMVVVTLGMSYLAWRQYASFNLATGDTAVFGYAFSHVLQGQFFPFFASEGTIMGNHPNFILWLWLPVYWLVPTIYSLFLFQSLMISLAAWPAYLLARDRTGNRLTGLIAAVGLLALPTIASQHVSQIHDDQFGLALMLFTFYFFEKKNFRAFCLCLAGSLLAKETLALNAGAFGIYALLRRRDWKWIAFPIGWSVGYLLFVLKGLMSVWQGSGTLLYTQVAYFEQYGKTPGEVLRNMLSHPLSLVQIMFQTDRLGYLWRLLLPLGLLLPFAGWAFVPALPTIGLNLLSSNSALRVIGWHYGSVLGGLLWMSFLTTLPRWNQMLTLWFGRRDYTRGLCLAVTLLALASTAMWLRPSEYHWGAARAAREQAVEAVPHEASVFCPDNMIAHFADRRAIHSLGGLHYWHRDLNQLFDYDFIVFDGNFVAYDWQQQRQLFQLIAGHPAYRSVFNQDKVFIFQRISTPQRILHW